MSSRQYKHIKAKHKAGICVSCTEPSFKSWRCMACYEKFLEWNRDYYRRKAEMEEKHEE